MKCQILFSGKNKKNIINLPSTENAHRVVKVKGKYLSTKHRNRKDKWFLTRSGQLEQNKIILNEILGKNIFPNDFETVMFFFFVFFFIKHFVVVVVDFL